jgi:hypothetical protein
MPIEIDAGDLEFVVNPNNEFATISYSASGGIFYLQEGVITASGYGELTITVTAQDGETTETAVIPIIASGEMSIVPASSKGDGQLRVGTSIKIPRAQFPKSSKLTYAWYRDGEVVDGATTAKYALTVEDYGHDLRALVTGVPQGSILSKAVEVAAGLITKAPAPSIKGKAAVGNTLTATTKAWIDGAELTYQWYRDGSAVDGATGETYELTPADFEATMTVGITGTLEAYEPLEKVSNGVTVVAGVLKYSEKPGISGDFVTGGTVTVNAGTWMDSASVSIVWSRNGEEFATTAADENTYVLTAEDYKTRLSAEIKVTAEGYKDASFKIKGRSVKIGTLTEVPMPTISGDATIDGVLEVDPGMYPDGAEFKFVWKRNGRVISGATESTYTLTARDAGIMVSVKVIATVPGYKTTRSESDGVEVLSGK